MKRKVLILIPILTLLVMGGFIGMDSIMNQRTLESHTTSYEIKDAFPSLTFNYPDGIYNSRDGTNRLFVVEQMGRIKVFENSRNVQSASVFLDIHDRVHLGALLGLAFHPKFTENRIFFVYYLADNPLRSVISQWSVLPDNADEANVTSEKILLEISQEFDSHGGGQLAFGPDGYLYIGLGDGQPFGDSAGNAQNCSDLRGKILRIDVDSPSHDREYSIPKDNPFAENLEGYREEIYAWGFRNPWRFSFDQTSGLLIAGDVGQDRMEEIDIVNKGKNYGWNIMEGTLPFNSTMNLNQTNLESPIWTYERNQGNATIGGFIYRGSEFSELFGSFIYGDYASGRIWALNCTDTTQLSNRELLKTNLNITSFGKDEKNELYFCSSNGKIYQITKAK